MKVKLIGGKFDGEVRSVIAATPYLHIQDGDRIHVYKKQGDHYVAVC